MLFYGRGAPLGSFAVVYFLCLTNKASFTINFSKEAKCLFAEFLSFFSF